MALTVPSMEFSIGTKPRSTWLGRPPRRTSANDRHGHATGVGPGPAGCESASSVKVPAGPRKRWCGSAIDRSEVAAVHGRAG